MTNIDGIEWDTSNFWEGVVVSKPQRGPTRATTLGDLAGLTSQTTLQKASSQYTKKTPQVPGLYPKFDLSNTLLTDVFISDYGPQKGRICGPQC